jgi:hypothetical protein
MSKNKDYEKLLSILDEILHYLVNKTEDSYKVNFYKMSSEVFNLEKSKINASVSSSTDFETIVSEIFLNFNQPFNKVSELRLATIHLHNENLITIDNEHNIEITFKGLLAYSDGIVNKWDSELSTSQRLKNMEDENLIHQNRMTTATEEMNQTNKSIRKLTHWIMIGALITILYQLVELLKTFFPCWFCKIQ